MRRRLAGAQRLGTSVLDPRPWLHLLRLVHHVNYAHVSQVRRARIGPGVAMAPNVSLRSGERVEIGAREVDITASNHRTAAGRPVRTQSREEADVVITRSLPPGSITVGVPARIVGARG